MRIALPIMIQNGVTNFVGLLDNIMVGRIGTNPMSGVAIVNQLLMVWNLCLFGGMSGISIFTAQFHGKEDEEGVRHTFRLLFMLGIVLFAAGILIYTVFRDPLVRLYLNEEGTAAEETLAAAHSYLQYMYFGLLPFAMAQVYSSVLRATGETRVPMQGSLLAVSVNLVGNYILIFGKFGLPAMGVAGAALATVLSRIAEMLYLVLWTHRNTEKNPYILNAYASMKVPALLLKNCFIKGMPLLINETLWSAAIAFMMQIYSRRGLNVIAAMNISQTISNLFSVVFMSMGISIGIIMGHELGAGKFNEVKGHANALSLFAVGMCLFTGTALFLCAGLFPAIYNTSAEVRELAAGLIRIVAVTSPIHAYANATYFTIRSGGKTVITFLFDSCFSWAVSVPVAFVLVSYTDLPVLTVYLCVMLADLLKCIGGYILVQKGVWINDITQLA